MKIIIKNFVIFGLLAFHFAEASDKRRVHPESPPDVFSIEGGRSECNSSFGGFSVRIWDLDQKRYLGCIEGTDVDFSLDSKSVFIGGENAVQLSLPEMNVSKFNAPLKYISALANASELVAYSMDQKIQRWDIETKRFREDIGSLRSIPYQISFSEDGMLTTYLNLDWQVSVYESKTHAESFLKLSSTFTVDASLSKNGRYLISAYRNRAYWWNMEDAEHPSFLDNIQIPGTASAVAISNDGTTAAIGYSRPYQVDEGHISFVTVWSLDGTRKHTFSLGFGLLGPSDRNIVFSTDGRRLLVGKWNTESAVLFDLETGQQIVKIENSRNEASNKVAISPDGRYIAVKYYRNRPVVKTIKPENGNIILEEFWNLLSLFTSFLNI